jgi:hypothetical protein
MREDNKKKERRSEGALTMAGPSAAVPWLAAKETLKASSTWLNWRSYHEHEVSESEAERCASYCGWRWTTGGEFRRRDYGARW